MEAWNDGIRFLLSTCGLRGRGWVLADESKTKILQTKNFKIAILLPGSYSLGGVIQSWEVSVYIDLGYTFFFILNLVGRGYDSIHKIHLSSYVEWQLFALA